MAAHTMIECKHPTWPPPLLPLLLLRRQSRGALIDFCHVRLLRPAAARPLPASPSIWRLLRARELRRRKMEQVIKGAPECIEPNSEALCWRLGDSNWATIRLLVIIFAAASGARTRPFNRPLERYGQAAARTKGARRSWAEMRAFLEARDQQQRSQLGRTAMFLSSRASGVRLLRPPSAVDSIGPPPDKQSEAGAANNSAGQQQSASRHNNFET